jgi:DMSO reductase anchor subunit
MRTSPIFMIILYAGLGVLFTVLSVHYAREDGLWSFWTIITMMIATYDYINAFRMYKLKQKIDKLKKK